MAIAALVVLSAMATAATFLLEPEPEGEPTETTTRPEANVPVPDGLTAVESPAGVQLDWEGDEGAQYLVLLMSDIAAPKPLEANAGPSFLVPMSEIAPDVGYCFAVAYLSALELGLEDTAGAFSRPVCIRGASETSVQGGG